MYLSRKVLVPILRDLQKKMVFIGGPRQSGKTSLAKEILDQLNQNDRNYFNWDFDEDRRAILSLKWSEDRLIVFDEIHKYPRWKNFVKGLYDKKNHLHQFLITGSARLDLYKKGGDSMLGRYHYWRLHPLTLNERPTEMSLEVAYKKLMTVGGFPEPFLTMDETEARRWRKDRFQRILREDIRDLERIQEIQNLPLLVDLLKERVGSLIVISNLAQDLGVAPNTVKRWIEILERMYLIFIVRPFTQKLARSISKPFKVYFYDNADVDGDEGARLENLVATHLIKYCHFKEDCEGYRYQLFFVRDKEGREIDFLIQRDKNVEGLIEVKLTDDKISPHLLYFKKKIKTENSLQLVLNIKREYLKEDIRVLNLKNYLGKLF